MELLIKSTIMFYQDEDLKTTDIEVYANVENIEDAKRFIALNLHNKIMKEASLDLGVEKKELEKEYDFSLHGNDFIKLVKQGEVKLNSISLTFEDIYNCSEDEYSEVYEE